MFDRRGRFMSEDIEFNWDEIIDNRFLEIEGELSALSEYSEALGRHLPRCPGRRP